MASSSLQGKDAGRLAAIRICATTFRHVMEECNRENLPLSFFTFPHGNCAVATLLLGSYLTDQGLGRFDYMLGEHRDERGWHSHAWLRQGTITIDITADQFEGIDEKIIVTRDSLWHDSLSPQMEGVADFRLYDMQSSDELEMTYTILLASLEAKKL